MKKRIDSTASQTIPQVHVRGGFSDRNKLKTENIVMQFEQLDDRTRIQLSNVISKIFFVDLRLDKIEYIYKYVSDFCNDILNDVFCLPNRIPRNTAWDYEGFFNECIFPVIETGSYDDVLTLIEYLISWLQNNLNDLARSSLYDFYAPKLEIELLNNVFEKEFVGYRYVNCQIVAITDKVEIKEIEDACNNPYEGCRNHLNKALAYLADRDNKDYKNSIKESICAVESICQIITANPKATLGEALKKLKEKGLNLHSAMESAISKLYGYTSDKGGIRHSEGMFVSNVTFEETKFMLVTCSAFVNFLIAENGKVGSENE